MRIQQRLLFLTLALTGLVGCTPTHVAPYLVEEPREHYSIVAVGSISAQDPLWNHYVPYVREGMIKRFRESEEFASVLVSEQPVLPDSCIIVTGVITDVEKGSMAARFLIGFGAGKSRVRGSFEVTDDNGEVLAQFSERETYSGGVGIGGADLVSIDQLIVRMGEETADAVIRWRNGEPL